MRNISQILYVSIRELLAKKTLYFLLFLLILITAAVGSQLYSITTQSGDTQALLAQKADVLAQLMQIWGNFTVYFVMIYAAAAIYNEVKSRSIAGVLAKPVSRTEFLLGKWMGVVSFFTIFILTGTCVILVFMFLWEIPVTFLFVTGIVHKIGVVLVYSSIAFVLSLFVPPIVGGGVAFILFLFRDLFEMMMEASNTWVRSLGHLLFYGSPAVVKDDLIRSGILDNLLNPGYGLYWSTILENFLYAGLLFFAGALLYHRKDITLN